MIDGISCRIAGIDSNLLHSRLDFISSYHRTTGELVPYSYANLRNFRVNLGENGVCTLRGSIHKFAHGGSNHTDFGFSELTNTIWSLADVFNVPPENFRLTNLEFGVNLNYPVEEITDNLLLFGTNLFTDLGDGGERFTGRKVVLSQYQLKVYGKATTNLRVETAVKRMQYLSRTQSWGYLTLASLTEPDVLFALGECLNQTWGKVFLREGFRSDGLKPNELKILNEGRYAEFWSELHKDNTENFKKRKKRFEQLQELYGTTSRKKEVAQLIKDKWQHLLNT